MCKWEIDICNPIIRFRGNDNIFKKSASKFAVNISNKNGGVKFWQKYQDKQSESVLLMR